MLSLKFSPNRNGGAGMMAVVTGPTGATGDTGATGATGAAGATSGIKQTYSSTTTDADPGAGAFRLNHATPASATAAYLDNVDSGGSTVSTIWDLIDDSTSTVKGILTIEKSTVPAVWVEYQVTGSVVDGTGYRKLTLTNGAGSGAFTNGDTFAITFTRTGDKGDTGATGATGPAGAMGGPVSSTDNAVVRFDGTGGTVVQDSAVLMDDTTGTTYPATNDSGALGKAAQSWADLFLASGGVINWNNGDVLVTHSANALAFSGASSGYTFDAVVKPSANDAAPLGASGTAWADLFLASGSVINWNAGDLTLTHSANDLALAGGTITLPNTGLHILDTNASHDLIIAPGSDLTVDRTLTVTTGDADRTLTLTANSSIGGTAYVASGTDVAVADGGTGLSSGTSGGVLAYTASGTLASSGALTANGVVIGGGAGAVPTATAAGVSGQSLWGQTSGAPGYYPGAASTVVTLTGINFNSANTDNAITITMPPGFTRFEVGGVRISGASASLSTSTIGLFTATGGGGVAIIAAGAAVTVTSSSENTNNNAMAFSVPTTATQSYNIASVPTLYFRIGTPQGSAATATVTLLLIILP